MQTITKRLRDTEFLVSEFGEVDDEASLQAAVFSYRYRLTTFPDRGIAGEVSLRNIGEGADWHVISVMIASLFFGIPKAHKIVRESLEEWRRIYNETKKVLLWLAPDRTIYYPDGHLFLISVLALVEDRKLPDLTFLDCLRLLDDNPKLQGLESLLFTFRYNRTVEQIAVARNGIILWRNTICLDDDMRQ